MMAMTDLMSQPSNNYSSSEMIDTEEPPLSFVSYTVPTAITSGVTLQERKQVTTFESRGLIYGSGSTGFRTWEAALHLGTCLSFPFPSTSGYNNDGSFIKGKRVIELGAGTGFISLLCKKYLGAEKVLMTDGNAKLVDLFKGPCLEQNGFAKENKDKHIQARQWMWGEPLPGDGDDDDATIPEQFDIALGADLVSRNECVQWSHCIATRQS